MLLDILFLFFKVHFKGIMRNEPVPKLRKLAQRKGKSFIKCRAQGNAHERQYSHSLFLWGIIIYLKFSFFFVFPEIKNEIQTGLMLEI